MFSFRRTLQQVRSRANVVRKFCESHDDFQPKKKAVPTGMEDVLKLIDEQVKGNDILLFMKGTPTRPQVSYLYWCILTFEFTSLAM